MEKKPRSSFVSYLALFSIVISFFLIYEGISNLLLLSSMSSSPGYRIAEELMPSMKVSPTESVLELLLQCGGIVASIGMYMRLEWGRVMFMIVLSIMTVWGIISSFLSYLALSQYFKGYHLGGSIELLILGGVVALGVNIYLIWKLSTQEIRNEFAPSIAVK